MPWGHIKQYRYPEPPYGCSGPPQTRYIYYTLYPLLQGGSSRGIPWRRLKEIHFNYTTMNACSEDVTASNVPSPLLMNILMLIYYLYFTQEASSKEILVLVITTVMYTEHCHAPGQGTIELTL